MEKEGKPGHLYVRKSKPEHHLYIRNAGVKPAEHKQAHLYIRKPEPEQRLYIRNVKRKPGWLIYAPPKQEAA